MKSKHFNKMLNHVQDHLFHMTGTPVKVTVMGAKHNHLGSECKGGGEEALLAGADGEHQGAACVSRHAEQLYTLQQGQVTYTQLRGHLEE